MFTHKYNLIFLQLLGTITTSELSQFLGEPNVIGNAHICYIYDHYSKTPEFLELVRILFFVHVIINSSKTQ